jgi:hypothetical protein
VIGTSASCVQGEIGHPVPLRARIARNPGGLLFLVFLLSLPLVNPWVRALLGLVLLSRRDLLFGGGLLLSFLAYYYFMASYPTWDGISSFGNRFFVSLTPLFVLGLASFLDSFSRWWRHVWVDFALASIVVGLFVLWNAGFVFQWGTQMIPSRGPIVWSEMLRNRYAVVPYRAAGELESYFLRRKAMMQGIEERDLERQPQLPAQ